MPNSDFLNENLAVQCNDLAEEINKVYQHFALGYKKRGGGSTQTANPPIG
jgi:hypothetical protein